MAVATHVHASPATTGRLPIAVAMTDHHLRGDGIIALRMRERTGQARQVLFQMHFKQRYICEICHLEVNVTSGRQSTGVEL
jgi:hypothetical protein